MNAVVIAAAMLAAGSASATVYRDLPPELEAAADAWDRAQMTSDKAELERLIADDLVLSDSRGSVQDKAKFVADSTAPGFRLEPFTVEEPVQKVMGDVAILGGVATLKGVDGGQPFSARLRFADVWRKMGGQWRVTYIHVTRAP